MALENSIWTVTYPVQNLEGVKCWQEYKLLQALGRQFGSKYKKILVHKVFELGTTITGI